MDFKVSRVKKFINENKDEDGNVIDTKTVYAFDLSYDRFNFYKLRLHNADDKPFIAFPAFENANNGKFLKYYWIDFTTSETRAIVDAVINQSESE